ncbi:hypothetical protein V5O48_016355 [Marasmius crinis-equi]|uniref:Uncharacterized protein n=1 Tax=Marasmius crinis-equi TaxID=585013 RepID=A0ABR3ERX9_9AGAR
MGGLCPYQESQYVHSDHEPCTYCEENENSFDSQDSQAYEPSQDTEAEARELKRKSRYADAGLPDVKRECLEESQVPPRCSGIKAIEITRGLLESGVFDEGRTQEDFFDFIESQAPMDACAEEDRGVDAQKTTEILPPMHNDAAKEMQAETSGNLWAGGSEETVQGAVGFLQAEYTRLYDKLAQKETKIADISHRGNLMWEALQVFQREMKAKSSALESSEQRAEAAVQQAQWWREKHDALLNNFEERLEGEKSGFRAVFALLAQLAEKEPADVVEQLRKIAAL